MNDLEELLRASLGRQEPAPDFAKKVLARTAAWEQRHEGWRPWAAGCIAASLLIGSWGAVEVRQRHDQQRGQMAHAQLIRALELTSNKLRRIQKKLDELNHE